MTLESAAPTKPCSESGSCCQRISSGTSPFSPRSTVCSSVRRSRSQKWIRCPYLPAPTSARSKPGSYAFGSPNSDETRMFLRGWYQKS